MKVGSWNVRSLLDSAQIKRPERRTTIVVKGQAKYNIDRADPSETHLTMRVN